MVDLLEQLAFFWHGSVPARCNWPRCGPGKTVEFSTKNADVLRNTKKTGKKGILPLKMKYAGDEDVGSQRFTTDDYEFRHVSPGFPRLFCISPHLAGTHYIVSH